MGQLRRTADDAMIGGVCGGIARWMDVDPSLVRVTFALISLLSTAFPGILVYVVLWAILPEE